jgi:hypothetical protein
MADQLMAKSDIVGKDCLGVRHGRIVRNNAPSKRISRPGHATRPCKTWFATRSRLVRHADPSATVTVHLPRSTPSMADRTRPPTYLADASTNR